MHAGRTYPFFPEYWATEAWFWPGFVPWKLHGQVLSLQPSPWDRLGASWQGVSEEGFVVSDRTQISYHWPLSFPVMATDLLVSLEQIASGGVDYARWKARLFVGATEVASAWLFQSKPQRLVSTIGQPFNSVDSPVITPPTFDLDFRPATYAEGGSPWPNY